MKATKKPVTIECFKYDGDLKNSDGKFYVPDWAEKAYNDGVIYFKDQAEMYIKTLEGDHHASVGDYVIKGVNGELYPYKPDIFEKTYDIETSEEKQGNKNGWKFTKDETPKTKEPVAIFPEYKGKSFACWNDYEKCWDDETADDYLCDKESVKCWYEIPPVPEEMKNA